MMARIERMLIEIAQIEAFLAVIETGGFSNAAVALHVTQPAISLRINLLEEQLNARLMDRRRGEIVLTEAGKLFVPYAQRALAAVRDGMEAVKSLDSREQGVVKIAIVGTLASTRLTKLLAAFRKHHRGVLLHLRTARSSEISEMVKSGEVQLGIRYFSDASPDLISNVIGQEEMVVAVSARRRFVNKKSFSAKELAGIPWVSFPAGSSGEPFADLLKKQLQKAEVEVEFLYVDSLTAQKRLIEADFAIGLLPRSSVQEELKLHTLKVVRVPELETQAPFALLHRKKGHLTKAMRTLMDALAGGRRL